MGTDVYRSAAGGTEGKYSWFSSILEADSGGVLTDGRKSHRRVLEGRNARAPVRRFQVDRPEHHGCREANPRRRRRRWCASLGRTHALGRASPHSWSARRSLVTLWPRATRSNSSTCLALGPPRSLGPRRRPPAATSMGPNSRPPPSPAPQPDRPHAPGQLSQPKPLAARGLTWFTTPPGQVQHQRERPPSRSRRSRHQSHRAVFERSARGFPKVPARR